MMKVDIAICTWNRADLLKQTLSSISSIFIPPFVNVRAIVVNNNSSDATDEVVVAANEAAAFEICLAHESRQGHTHSRNKCIELANSDLMIWTDDDVKVEHDWLSLYVKAARETKDVFWGGVIEPVFLPEKPDWISENWSALQGCFAARDLGKSAISFTAERLPYGANFAIRTHVQKAFPFGTELGRRGEEVLGEDELDLFRRLLEAGYSGSWIPDSRVFHTMDQARMSERFIYKYFEGQGEALVMKGESASETSSALYWSSVWNYLMYRFKKKWAESPVWVSHMIDSGACVGETKRNQRGAELNRRDSG